MTLFRNAVRAVIVLFALAVAALPPVRQALEAMPLGGQTALGLGVLLATTWAFRGIEHFDTEIHVMPDPGEEVDSMNARYRANAARRQAALDALRPRR